MTEHQIDYEALAQNALRSVVKSVLTEVAKTGLPGNHHFYIAFDTQAEGVGLSRRLRDQYPSEMTIVLQHVFWELSVFDDRFEVKLTFNKIPERLIIPFSAVKVFFDPSVPYGLQFEPSDLVSENGKRSPALTEIARAHDEVTPRIGDHLGSDLASDDDLMTTLTRLADEPALDGRIAKPGSDTSSSDRAGSATDAGEETDGDQPARSAVIVELDRFRKK